MRTNIQELEAVAASTENYVPPSPATALQSFVLPKLHVDVPIRSCMEAKSPQSSEYSELARHLVDARVINPKQVPDDAESSKEVLQYGIQAWFDHQIGDLKILEVSVALLNPESMQSTIECCSGDPFGCSDDDDADDDDENEKELRFGLQWDGDTGFNGYTLSEQAQAIERSQPGLFKAVMKLIIEAAGITVPVRTSDHFLGEFEWMWEAFNAESRIPSDHAAMESLMARFEDEATAKEYLPSVILPLLGGDLCLPSLSSDKKPLSTAALRRIALGSQNRLCATLAQQALKLRSAIDAANKVGARLPTLEGLNVHTIEPGCTLLYQFDNRLYGLLDDSYQAEMSAGNADPMFGLEAIPNTSQELKEYFKKMEYAIAVLRELDNTLALVATQCVIDD